MNKVEYIRNLESALSSSHYTLEESMACIKYAVRLLDADLPVIFDRRHLAHLLGIKPKDFTSLLYAIDLNCYHELVIEKKTGGVRKISIPSVDLKYIQKWILNNIISYMHVSEYANGFVAKKSILTNALAHVNKECVINIDLKDFFPSVHIDKIFRIFRYYGYTKEISYILAKLCSYNGELPQGSPASPAITNVVCLRMDKRLSGLAEKYNATYTRYADDITFSGSRGISSMIKTATKIIEDEGFQLNDKKTRVAFAHERQEVTGLIVNNGHVKISRKYKRTFRQEIYYCQKYGVSQHQAFSGLDYHYYKEHLYGKAFFIKMVEPALGNLFLEELDKISWEY